MISTSYCIICNTSTTNIFKSSLAAFVWERMLNKPQLDDVPSAGIYCPSCNFIHTEYRFSPVEEARYYHEYMQEKSSDPANTRQFGEYVFHRARNDGTDWLPWIQIYQSDTYLSMRKDIMHQCFNQYGIALSSIATVLDYGGDRGQYIPDEIQTKYVLEVENRTPVTGVSVIGSVSGIRRIDTVDLVMCCHTLEHVSYPMDLVRDMKRYLKPGGLIYLEVPDEIENLNKPGFKFHEHINLFTPETLVKILEMEGFEPSIVYKIEYKATDQSLERAQSIIGRLKEDLDENSHTG